MQSTVVGVFPSVDRAEAAYRDLLAAGITRDDISVMAREAIERGELVDAERREPGGSSAAVGMGAGAALGGLGGLLVGLGLLTIPGIGPVLAAGPLASALAGAGLGAVGGAFVGALVDLGIPEDEAEQLAEAVRRGGILLAARVDDETIDRVVEIMEHHGALDVAERVKEWRGAGWSRFDHAAEPYEADELERERRRLGAGQRGPGGRYVRVYRVEVRRRIA
jgi:uncharacterized membrane protein